MIHTKPVSLLGSPFVIGLLALSMNACTDVFDDIIGVEVQDRVLPGTLDDPVHAPVLAASAWGDFECALSSVIVNNGLLTDELNGTNAPSTTNHLSDSRNPDPSRAGYGNNSCGSGSGGSRGVYMPLSSARWFADDVLEKLDGWTETEVPDREALIARTSAVAGYSLVLLGESMCSAALDAGPEIGPAQLFEEAEVRFDRAITAAQAAGTSDFLNMARIGRARVRINQGNRAGAVEDARAVPEGFVALATRGGGHATRENPVYVDVTLASGVGLGVEEPFRDVTWQGEPDPRVPVVDAGVGTQNVPYFDQRKYNSDGASIPIARWEEAQLIIAEVEGGQAAIDIINELHVRAGIPPFTADASDAEAIEAHVIEERRREFFLEGHRMGDIRRFELELVPPPGVPYVFGGSYGSARCWPLPDVERNSNPNIN